MIIMDLKIHNILGFSDIHFNFSYPKKLAKNVLGSESLKTIPSFNYRKINIIVGSNSSGKSCLGKTIWNICLFLNKRESKYMYSLVAETANNSTIDIDFITTKNKISILHRVSIVMNRNKDDELEPYSIGMNHQNVILHPGDNYEKAVKSFSSNLPLINYLDCLNNMSQKLGWHVSMPIAEHGFDKFTYNSEKENINEFTSILYKVLKTLDPSIIEVKPSKEIDNAFIINFDDGKNTIVKSGDKISDIQYLSSGSKYGFAIASTLYGIKSHSYSLFFIDELFSYIDSDIEIGALNTMISLLGDDEQLFFTSHNTNILSLGFPLHSFFFLGKEIINNKTYIHLVNAADVEKRNNVVVKNLYDNDVFGMLPSLEYLFSIEDK